MSLFSKQSKGVPKRRQIVADTSVFDFDAELSDRYTFRRNRTFTGSSSSAVVSAAEATNAQVKSPRLHHHSLRRRRRHVMALLGGILVGAIAIAIIMAQCIAVISIRMNDMTITADQSYKNTIIDYFNQRPFERFQATVDEENLTRYVQSNSPEIKHITIRATGFGQAEFVLSYRRAVAGWVVDDTQQYVDSEGVAFTRNYGEAPAVTIIDESGIDPQAGRTVASNRFLGFVGKVVGYTAQQGLIVREVRIPLATTRQVEILLADVDYPIKMSIDRSAGEQVEDMSRVVRYARAHSMPLAYLDVRVSGRAFYQNKD